jgi:hypothetical protein
MNIVKMEGITSLPLFTIEEGVSCFDFNKIIPMAESLKVESGSITELSIIYYLTDRCTLPLRALDEKAKEVIGKRVRNSIHQGDWAQEIFDRALEHTHGQSQEEKEKLYRKGEVYVSNYQKYGHTDWYDWSIENRGTKWNAYCNEQEDEDTITFETAWSNPEQVMLQLSKMYPEATIEHWWADEDIGNNSGYRVYQGGHIIEGDYNDFCSSAAYETYVKCWGESQCLYQDDEGNWIKRDCDECDGCN